MYTAVVGDIVRMPNGSFGRVVFASLVDGGRNIKVCVDPYVNLPRKLWMRFTGQLCFYGERINRLKPMPSDIRK